MGDHLEEATRATVIRLCGEGREHAAHDERAEALACFLAAWELLPEPKERCDAATYVLAAVGDLLRASGGPADALPLLLGAKGRTAGGAGAPGSR